MDNLRASVFLLGLYGFSNGSNYEQCRVFLEDFVFQSSLDWWDNSGYEIGFNLRTYFYCIRFFKNEKKEEEKVCA